MKMKYIKTILFALLPVFIPFSAMSAEKYTHAETGIIFPNEIAEHKMIGTHVYEEKELGESIDFSYEGATATVYIYDYNQKEIKDDPAHSLIMKELSASLGMISELQKMGTYDDVQIGKDGRMSGKDGDLVIISIPVTYKAIKNADTGEKIPPQPIDSMVSIGIYSNHFIKIRYSFPYTEQDDLKKKYEHRDEFISDIRKLVLEVDLKDKIKKEISTYLTDPLSQEAKKARETIVTYANLSALVKISIGSEIMSWLKPEGLYGQDLFGAYVVGQVNYQLSSNNFEPNHEAGMEQVLKVYTLLKDKDKNAAIPFLDEQLKNQ